MGVILRYILLAFCAAFLAMLAEPFFSQFLKEVGIDTSTWAGPVVMVVSTIIDTPWFQTVAVFIVGATIGAWGHWAATKLDRLFEGSASDAKPWQPVYRSRQNLKIYEAACLLADEIPTVPTPPGAARGYQGQIEEAILSGQIEFQFPEPSPSITAAISRPLTGAQMLQEWRRSQVRYYSDVSRTALISFFQNVGDEKAVGRLGGTH
jgi:hypothetical protein